MNSEVDNHDEYEFWLVWNPSNKAPMHRHDTVQSANKEAARLARLQPEDTFYVLHASRKFKATRPVEQVELLHTPF